MLRRLCFMLLLLLVSLPLMAQDSAEDLRILAISPIPPLDPPLTEATMGLAYIDAIQTAVDAGVNGSLITETWSALEPTSGQLNPDSLTGYIGFMNDTHDHALMLGIQVINTSVKETPADLQDVPFDSPEMIDRFKALVDALTPYVDSHVHYLTIGNEVDVYLSFHPEEWDTYTRFYQSASEYVRQVWPHVQVGVTVTFGGAQADPEAVARLTETSDVFILTYYPLNPDFTPLPPDAPLTDFPLMLEIAGDKPLILQEVGYPAAEGLGSSEREQAEFVHHVFDAWDAAGDRIPFLNFFAMGDFSPQMCLDFLVYYQLPGAELFYDYLCSLGFHTVDGTPRAAWEAFVQEASTP